MYLDNQAPATVAALSTPGLLVCYRCRQTGHYNFNCLLSFRRPGDPDLGGGSPSQGRDSPGQYRGRSPPWNAHRRRPSHPSERGTPKQGTNGDQRPQKPHEPRSPSPKPSPPN
ncbi:hypothetical protein chiPu_0031760 [Chiloscyllium punctatum]|uniref:CCHC-type domain-containing protein n=1 Tax=Chiloscyllium punctatum TaxID=137246 RepID=A0A401TXG4_CHIPU|nr:hypothetical protein [Chiloscyllium punctatum]